MAAKKSNNKPNRQITAAQIFFLIFSIVLILSMVMSLFVNL